MCGIAGKLTPRGLAHGLTRERKVRVLECIRHRGPDVQRDYEDGGIWFGHVRLSIIDLSEAANQPMATPDGRYVICYNGEVYNFDELARSLALENLRSNSDTEVVLAAFAKLGLEAPSRFNGMFAFAVYDRLAQKVWLVRDRFGIKPLYYRVEGHGLTFASEIKALLALSDVSPACNLSSLHEWAYFGAALGEQSLYAGVRKLLPGHYLEFRVFDGSWRVDAYWSARRHAQAERTEPRAAVIEQTRHLLDEAVKRHLVSDVPVSIFLSGGVDSSAIVAFAVRHYPGRIATYSAGFDFDKGPNELAKARRVATHFGTDHRELFIAGCDIGSVVEKMIDHHGEPFSDAANIPLYLLSQKVCDSTKVVLQGDGGDEIFGGYRRYTTLTYYRFARALAAVGLLLNAITPRGIGHFQRRRYFKALLGKDAATVMALLSTPDAQGPEVAGVFGPGLRSAIAAQDPFARYRSLQADCSGQALVDQMLAVDVRAVLPDVFLEKVDRATMASSVEARVPFLDTDLVDFCMGLPARVKMPQGRKKRLLKQALSGIVPDDVLHQKKVGFSVPFGYWLTGPLRNLFHDHAEVFKRTHPSVLDHGHINRLYDKLLKSEQDTSFLLWKVLNFMIWVNRTRVTF